MTDAARTTATIERLGHQGDGIAPGPLFVPRALPGEEVSGIQVGQSLTDIRITTPSSDRVQAPCRHYKACGGCQLQHASDAFVSDWKLEFVKNALAGRGLTTNFLPVQTSPAYSRRRATVTARRTKKGATVGFHGRASEVITEIPDCHLLSQELKAALPMVENLAMIGASRKAPLAVTLTLSTVGLDILVKGGKPLDGNLRIELGRFIEDFGLARLSWDDEPIGMAQAPTQQFGRADVCPPPGAFLQATVEGERALVSTVKEIVGKARRIVDLFAGCGTFSLPLAEKAEVLAVEGDRSMTEALEQGWRGARGLKKVSTETRDLFRNPLLPEDLLPFGAPFEAVVIDPPRAGADAQIAELANAKIPIIAYVSCSPVTFARDAETLVAAGYTLNFVQVVDQFRWSAHTELVASFSRNT